MVDLSSLTSLLLLDKRSKIHRRFKGKSALLQVIGAFSKGRNIIQLHEIYIRVTPSSIRINPTIFEVSHTLTESVGQEDLSFDMSSTFGVNDVARVWLGYGKPSIGENTASTATDLEGRMGSNQSGLLMKRLGRIRKGFLGMYDPDYALSTVLERPASLPAVPARLLSSPGPVYELSTGLEILSFQQQFTASSLLLPHAQVLTVSPTDLFPLDQLKDISIFGSTHSQPATWYT